MNETQIQEICLKNFQVQALHIERKKIGICNEVYEVKFESNSYIIRMNRHKDILYGTNKHLPIFKKLDIKTPDLVAEDYSKTDFPFCYHILTKIKGKDLGLVISSLSPDQLKSVADEISEIFKKFNDKKNQLEIDAILGTGKSERGQIWEELERNKSSILARNAKSKVLDDEILAVYFEVLEKFKAYFLDHEAKWFYDDICYKNVMIYDGQFTGLVDLDFLSKGDYLSAVGAIISSYYGEEYGKIYLDRIVEKLGLSNLEKQIIRVYAIWNLVLWTSEEGIQFNSNSKGEINWAKVETNKSRILSIYESLDSL